MDLIILNDGLYQLIPVTKQVMEGIAITAEVDCFDLCEILRLKLSGYVDTLNLQMQPIKLPEPSFIICRFKVST